MEFELLEDRVLALKFKAGSEAALGRIYEKYRDDLLGVAAAMLNNKAAAEDIVHDVFISFVRNRRKFVLKGSLKAYLMTAAVNKVRNFYRQKKTVRLDESSEIASGFKGSEQWIIETEDAKIVNDALGKIAAEQREAVVLHTHGQLKFRQIAAMQGVSVKTAQSRYRYGIEKLQSLLNGKVAL